MILPISLPLLCHAQTPCTGVRRVEVDLSVTDQRGLSLCFRIDADQGALIIPPSLLVERQAERASSDPLDRPTDLLWQHSCCELFLSREGSCAYREFNFSPSGQWAAYAFSDTRQRDQTAEAGWRTRPELSFRSTNNGFELSARLAATQMPEGDGALKVGLAAVLELRASDGTGYCTYWALHHPSPQADFHHRSTFALTLETSP